MSTVTETPCVFHSSDAHARRRPLRRILSRLGAHPGGPVPSPVRRGLARGLLYWSLICEESRMSLCD